MTKTFILMRHPQEQDDRTEDPSLTPDGIGQAEEMADQLFKKGLIPNIIVCSPVKRAFQAAAVMAKRFADRGAPQPQILTDHDLESDGSSIDAFKKIQRHITQHAVTLSITSEPKTRDISRFLGKLYDFDKAECLVYQEKTATRFNNMKAEAKWYLAPLMH